MKVCHFISPIDLGRSEIYVDLTNALCESIEVSLLIPKGTLYRDRIHPAIEVIEYQSKDTQHNPFLLIEIVRKIRNLKPDIVHTSFAKATEIFMLVNKVLQLPHVVTKHNPRKRKVFNRAPNVIAVSDIVKQSIKQENARVIHNGITPVEPLPRTNREQDIHNISHRQTGSD